MVAKIFHDESLPMAIRERLKKKGQAVHKMQIKKKSKATSSLIPKVITMLFEEISV